VAIKHREMLSILLHVACYGQLDTTQLAGAEACSLYALQTHQAVTRNPRPPTSATWDSWW
jgi:hypothetical protein